MRICVCRGRTDRKKEGKERKEKENTKWVWSSTHELRMERSSQSVIYLLYLRRFSFWCGFLVHFAPFPPYSFGTSDTRLHIDSIDSLAGCYVNSLFLLLSFLSFWFLLLLQHLDCFICLLLTKYFIHVATHIVWWLFLVLECSHPYDGLINVPMHVVQHSTVFLCYHPHFWCVFIGLECVCPFFANDNALRYECDDISLIHLKEFVCKAIYFLVPVLFESQVKFWMELVVCRVPFVHTKSSRFSLLFDVLDRERKNGNNNNKVKREYTLDARCRHSKFYYFSFSLSFFVSLLCFIIIISSSSSVCRLYFFCSCFFFHLVYCSLLSQFFVRFHSSRFSLLIAHVYIFRRFLFRSFICCAFSLLRITRNIEK